MKPEAPLLRRFFLPAEEQLYLPMYLPAADVKPKRPAAIRGCAACRFYGFDVTFGGKYGILYI